MNKLNDMTRAQIIHLLCEGNSMRSAARIAAVSINTVTKLLVDAGIACAEYHNRVVCNVPARRVQVDEIWSFCSAKEKNVPFAKSAPAWAGDVWTWTALDSNSKMILSYMVGDRSSTTAMDFMADLKERLAFRVQLTLDDHKVYLEAVERVFGADVDFAQLVKLYGPPLDEHRPGECTAAKKTRVTGTPDYSKISTSHVERHNLTMRMQMRRFTRLTNRFSKKLENHVHIVALYTVYYNFAKIHTALRLTPAMEAGLADRLWTFDDIVGLVNANTPNPKPRGPHKKRIAISN